MNLIIRQARLQDGSVVDIGIEQGFITDMAPNLAAQADQELNAAGQLTLPAFVNGQLHACKSFWRRLLSQLPPHLQTLPRFEAAKQVKYLYTEADIFNRVDEVMKLAIQHGTCAIRLFGDVDEVSGLNTMQALLRIRQKYAPRMTVQVVAFPQEGVLSQTTASLMREALQAGADVVGGIPWIEPDEAHQQQHIQMGFDLAQEFDRPLHFVCDDVADSRVRSLAYVAEQTLARHYQGRVSATQCAALSFYPDEVAAQVIQLVRQAGLTIFCNSHVSLIATEFDQTQHPWPRSITRVRDLLAAEVPVACGQDDIDNWFYAFGRNDLLEVAQFMAHTAQFAWSDEVDRVLPMVTTIPAQVLGLENYGLYVGAEANLIVLAASTWHEAIQFQPCKQYVVLRGKLAAQTEQHCQMYL